MIRRRAAVLAAATLAVTGISTPAAAAADPFAAESMMRRALAQIPNAWGVACGFEEKLKSHANGLYVSMRVEEGGRLIAMAPSAGPWERFTICRAEGNGATFIYSPTAQRWVSVRIEEGGIVRAAGEQPGPWELFYTSGFFGYGDRYTTVLHANANNSYASARIEDGGRLHTGYRQIGQWEVYSW